MSGRAFYPMGRVLRLEIVSPANPAPLLRSTVLYVVTSCSQPMHFRDEAEDNTRIVCLEKLSKL